MPLPSLAEVAALVDEAVGWALGAGLLDADEA